MGLSSEPTVFLSGSFPGLQPPAQNGARGYAEERCLWKLVDAARKDVGRVGEDPGEEAVFATEGVGLHEQIRRAAEFAEALAEGEAEHASGPSARAHPSERSFRRQERR